MTIKNLVIDGEKDPARSTGTLLHVGDYQRIDGVEVKRAQTNPNGGIYTGTLGAFMSGNGIEVLNSSFHDNDGCPLPSGCGGYGIYFTGLNSLIDNCDFYNNGGYGLQMYDQGSSRVSNNTVRNSRFWGNNTANHSIFQVVLSSGSNNQISNSVIYSPANQTGGLQIDYGCTGCKVYNNKIYNNSGAGILISSTAINTDLSGNQLNQNNPNLNDLGVGTSIK
jgi:parallel beta-helix repeat protein